METRLIELFDTTLRDGTQGEAVNLSVRDKLTIAHKLDEFGIDIIEGGWPGSNPRDEEFFKMVKNSSLRHARMCAFGSTARPKFKVAEDTNLNALLAAETPYVSIFGKTWQYHAHVGLGISDAENEELIFESVRYLTEHGRKVIFDAEHFFDGYRDNSPFALKMIAAAQSGGAVNITLCDTNGGSLPHQIQKAMEAVKKIITLPLGAHVHNDGGLAVANTLTAVECGATHVQGTINGVGERCGNADLVAIIPNLLLKMNCSTKGNVKLEHLTSLSNYVYEVMNLVPNNRAPFVGKSAFAHKGGIHVSAVLKDSKMYEHIVPGVVGNSQRVLVSDLSGQSNIKYKAAELGISVEGDLDFNKRIVSHIKTLEHEGYQFDGAEASFELILREERNEFKPFFKTLDSKISVVFDNEKHNKIDAVLKIEVDGQIEHTAAEGDGPVNALDNALRKALTRFYPAVQDIVLVDYKVRVLDETGGTAAKVRVLISSTDGNDMWTTVGVSENIIEASWQALCDSVNYKLFKLHQVAPVVN